jgi:hypothetical protein
LYFKRLPYQARDIISLTVKSPRTLFEEVSWNWAAHLYAFAWYIHSQELCTEIVERLWRFLRLRSWIMLPKYAVIHYIWESTPKNCGLQKLAVALYVWKRRGIHLWRHEAHTAIPWSEQHPARRWLERFPDDFCVELLFQANRRATGEVYDPWNEWSKDCPFLDFQMSRFSDV